MLLPFLPFTLILLVTLTLTSASPEPNPTPNPQNGWKPNRHVTKQAGSTFSAYAQTIGANLDQLAVPAWYEFADSDPDSDDDKNGAGQFLQDAGPVTTGQIPVPNIYKIFPPLFGQKSNLIDVAMERRGVTGVANGVEADVGMGKRGVEVVKKSLVTVTRSGEKKEGEMTV